MPLQSILNHLHQNAQTNETEDCLFYQYSTYYFAISHHEWNRTTDKYETVIFSFLDKQKKNQFLQKVFSNTIFCPPPPPPQFL